MPEEIFDVVNERDEVIDRRPRREVHARGLWHRAVHVLVFNARGEVFLQKRSMKKDIAAGKWDSSSSGHLDADEDYDACAVREVREEIGLRLAQTPARLFKIDACKGTGWEFCWIYRCENEGPFVLHPEEIESGDWFTPEAERNAKHIAGGRETFAKEMEFFEQALRGDWLIGPLSLADFTLYPSIAQLVRMEAKQDPSLNVAAMLGPKLTAWRKRFEALPYFEKCTPPHWKA